MERESIVGVKLLNVPMDINVGGKEEESESKKLVSLFFFADGFLHPGLL